MEKLIKSLFQCFFARRVRKSQIRRSCFANLPVDIITDIFVRLPIKSVLICRCVCKHWNTFISDTNFAKLLFTYTPPTMMIRRWNSRIFHLVEYDRIEWHEKRNNLFCLNLFEVLKPNNSSSIKLDPKFEIFLPNPKSIQSRRVPLHVRSCNGLFFMSSSKEGDFSFVCNPITGVFIRLPKQPPILTPCEQISWCFGFHPKTNQYKVMRIHIFKHDHRMVVEMHTVGTSTWINIEVDYPKYLTHVFKHPTYFNGALHWICRDVDRNYSIWAFDFDTEQFQFFSYTPKSQGKGTILKFRGSLCFMYFDELLISIWMMKRYEVGESWTPIFQYSITISQLPSCMAYLDRENQEFIIFGTPWYDFKVHGKFQVLGHVPTLIPLKNIIIGDNVEVQNIYSLDKKKSFKLSSIFC
ncbi:hypothetical protein Ahy_B06g080439 [Arachis hypogaea]|uniref:F-box domain-containing protein n=1 Tax=Arachis hypogaea TaxID=3818 RepID=A0A444YI30_ARAHY|nr:hypothetical protein Ahy_B06g080439 [Arachis hypogaea]